MRKWHQEHPEYWRKYYQEHREQRREYDRKHRVQKLEYMRKWHQEHREQQRKYRQTRGYIYRRINLWKQQGIKISTWQEFRALYLKSDGKCEICNRELRMTNLEKLSKPVAYLDHDYQSGLPRGILCNTCNTRVGIFEDRANKYRTYVEKKRRENECHQNALAVESEV
jgi:hypothetical protein